MAGIYRPDTRGWKADSANHDVELDNELAEVLANATEGAARATVLSISQTEPSHGFVACQACAQVVERPRDSAAAHTQIVPERPPVGESQSNGIIERAVLLVAGQARTLKAALEHRFWARVPPDARILCWLVEFAAYLMNRCDIGTDGKTPLQILQGRRDNTPVFEFGEKILYMPAKPARGGKWELRFHPGVFVGMLNSS